jgi:adenine-specific DNA-methyltransferase
MNNFLEKLEDLLKKDERVLSEDKSLLKNKVQELAYKNDEKLLNILLSDDYIKKHFFIKLKKTLIFDKEKFISFVSSKQFLPDSYTSFKNKIGLAIGDEYLGEKKEVVLNWPYKDCVLEGGMTKEDQKRDEIFYNETLAPDDINRLLDPKVFTNFKRIDKKGEHELDGFKRDEKGTIKDNLIIKGNNLLALASLKKEFAGKVKLIYIDPPYNTGNDGFKYNDSFSHSSWLVFMKNRLEIAKELLRNDGIIFVQCDYRENSYLRILMDQIFGRDNLVNEITWKKYGGVKNQAAKKLTTQQETILLYSKSLEYNINFLYNPLSEKYVADEYKYVDENGRRYAKLRGRGYQGGGKETKIKYLDENQGSPITSLWAEDGLQLNTSSSEKIGDFTGQKPEALLKRIIEMGSSAGDLVLDYHAGTGTTLAVAHKTGRQYIGVEQMDYIHDLSEARLNNIIKGDQSGISKDVNWKGGGDFIYMELAKWNEEWIEKIQKAKTGKELFKLWDEMKETAFLSYKVDLKKIDANAKGFADLSIADQKKFLIECLDKNQLYVNFSEIEDKEYGVSKEDKELNKNFYNEK